MTYQPKEPIKKDESILEHNTLYSDGIILKPEGDTTCRMIFYERKLKNIQKLKNFENDGEFVIQYEIRVPIEVISGLYFNLDLMKKEIDKKTNPEKSKTNDIPTYNNYVYDTDKKPDGYIKNSRQKYIDWCFKVA